MATMLSQSSVNAIDFFVIVLCLAMFSVSILGALFTVAYSWPQQKPAAREFNYLWRSRFLSQVLGALYALSELLRLQVLWGPHSVLVSGGYQASLMCRIFTAVQFGFLEPSFLLLALFSCVYSVQGRNSSHPNSNIVFFALGLSLPFCAAQVICALFTAVFDLNYGLLIFYRLFATFDTSEVEYCQVQSVDPQQPSIPVYETSGNCDFCVFPLLSTLISATFAAGFLLVAWRVTHRIVATVINKILIRRMRMLQLLVGLLLPVSVVCRGVTVLFNPFELSFEVVSVAFLILSISVILVLKPTHDAYITDKNMNLLLHDLEGGIKGGWPHGGVLSRVAAADDTVPVQGHEGSDTEAAGLQDDPGGLEPRG